MNPHYRLGQNKYWKNLSRLTQMIQITKMHCDWYTCYGTQTLVQYDTLGGDLIKPPHMTYQKAYKRLWTACTNSVQVSHGGWKLN